MRTTTYWVAVHKDEAPAYSIRGKTKRAVYEEMERLGYSSTAFEEPRKTSIQYEDLLDLVDSLLQGESHLDKGKL